MIDPLLIEEQIGQFLREDIGFGDLTSTIMIDEETTGVFDVNARAHSHRRRLSFLRRS